MKNIIFFLLFIYTSISIAATSHTKTLTILLDEPINPNHAPLVIAQELNYFKDQGLTVVLNNPSKEAKADIYIQHQPQFMQQIDNHISFILVGTLIDKPLNCIVTLKGNHIKSVADLKGKRIAMTDDALNNAILNSLLKKRGLTEKNITLSEIHDHLNQALLSHQVDAVGGMMRNVEVPFLELSDHKVLTFFPEEYGIPNYNELIFTANKSHLHDKRFPGFLIAVKRAIRYLDENPKEAWQIFIKRYPDANNEITREAWFNTLPYFAENPETVNTKEWHHFAIFMQKHKLIKKVQKVNPC